MSNPHNLWEKSSEAYHHYALKFPQYKKTSKKLVELADINKEDTIVDLACGTGITTEEILAGLSAEGKVYAIDYSQGMLDKAKDYLNDERVQFVKGRAVDINKLVTEKVDKVLCNSASWQFSDYKEVLFGIEETLKQNGVFIFNLPEQFYEFEDEGKTHRNKIVKTILDKMKEKGCKPKKDRLEKGFTEQDITELVRSTTLEIVDKTKYEFEGSGVKDSIEFFKIPAVGPSFEGISHEEQKEILDEVKSELEETEFIPPPNRWIYFKLQKN